MPKNKLLDLQLPERPAGCNTVRKYLVKLLGEFLAGEASPKYGMTGESDWEYDLYAPMINAGLLPGRDHYENDGYGLDEKEEKVLKDLLLAAVRELK